MGAAVAAVILARERRIVDQFRDAGATSPSVAQSLDDVGIDEGLAFRRLRRHEAIREASPGMFYLDEPVWNAVRGTRRRIVVVVLVIAVIVSVGVTFGFLSLT